MKRWYANYRRRCNKKTHPYERGAYPMFDNACETCGGPEKDPRHIRVRVRSYK